MPLPFVGLLAGPALRVVGALPGWLKGAIAGVVVTGAVLVVAYEGISIPIPFLRDIDLIDGRVDQVREREKAICQAAKLASIAAAGERDKQAAHISIARAEADRRRAEERARQAEQELREDEAYVATLEPQLRDCRRATDDDIRRLQ